ncbi:hypothetical protein Tco_0382441 [Tanacetum coccineum]
MLQVQWEIMQLVKQGLLSVITARVKGIWQEDPGIPNGQAIQTTIPQNATFKTNDLDAYDYDCDDISSTKAVLMANLSSYDLGVLSKVVQIILWYLDSGCFKHMTGNCSQLINFVHKFLGTFRFINDQISKIMGYGDYQMGKVTISRVYYMEGLGHNLFFVGQFYDFDLEVAFRKHTCYIRDLEDVDLLKGSRGSNLYMLSLEDMMLSSPICLLSKASKIKPMRIQSINGWKYILVIVDDYSQFTLVVKVRTTPDAITEGSWGFEHTKKVFKEEVIPFINSLWVSFKDFEIGLYSELNEVKTMFYQIEAVVDQCSADKKYFDIQKKEVSLDNDRLLDHIICLDVMNIVMHVDYVLENMLPADNKCLVNDNLEIKRLEQENDHLFDLLLSQDIVHIYVNSLASPNDYREMQQGYIDEYNENLMLKAELAKKEQMMSTLAEYMIVAGAKNHPLMLDKTIGPLVYPTIEENGQVRDKKYAELTEQEKLQDDCDVQALNIVLQGTELSYQEGECKLYKEFDKFTSIKGESLHEYYLCFVQLINDMHTIGMTMQQVQVNTKFPNALQPEWSKFVTNVKLAKNIYPDPLSLVVNHQTQSNSVQYPQQLSSIYQTAHSSQPYLPTYEAPPHLQQYQHAYQPQISHLTPYVPQNAYHSPSISQQPPVAFLHINSGLAISVCLPGDDPIACLNKEMTFMSTVVASRTKGNATSSGGNNAAGQSRVVKCYNFQGEGHMTRQYTKPKRPKNSAWFKEKMLLVQSQKLAQVLDEEQLAFLEDPGIPDDQAIQITIPQNAAFKTNDLDAYDYDCDDISSAKAVLMANLLSYDSGVLSEVVQIVLWYLDSGCSKHMTGNRSQLINFVHKFLGTFRFINDQIAKIMGYGDYQMGKVMISRVYYVEGLGHNLFSVGQFYDFDLEVAFRKHTYYIRDLEDVDLLKGSRGSNLYTLSLEDTMLSSPICLLSKASKTKS